jgi:hypothetical protein
MNRKVVDCLRVILSLFLNSWPLLVLVVTAVAEKTVVKSSLSPLRSTLLLEAKC